jgi:hypothetical protein
MLDSKKLLWKKLLKAVSSQKKCSNTPQGV